MNRRCVGEIVTVQRIPIFAPESGHHEGKTGHIKRSTGRRSGALNISASQTHCLFEYVADRVRGWRARRVITGAALN